MKMIDLSTITKYRCPSCGFEMEDRKGQDIDCPKCDKKNVDLNKLLNTIKTTGRVRPGFAVDENSQPLHVEGEINGKGKTLTDGGLKYIFDNPDNYTDT